jgi:predicted porin
VGLWDVAAEYTTDSYDLAVEYTRSTELWPATSYDTNTGAELPGARHLSAVSAMGRYKTDLFGIATDFSAVYSKSIIGPDNTEFDELTQHVIGMEMHINKYMDIGAEGVFNGGFQPFVGIQDVSDSGVDSQVGIVGLKLRL